VDNHTSCLSDGQEHEDCGTALVRKTVVVDSGIYCDLEKKDIEDLNVAIATTQHNDIKTVYNNLFQGSLNHLNAFETDLARY
jgi:hypothetical protein